MKPTQSTKDNRAQVTKKWQQIVARTWHDPQLKADLLRDPEGVLRREGIEAPSGRRLVLVEDTDTTHHLVLPRPPSSDVTDLSSPDRANESAEFYYIF